MQLTLYSSSDRFFRALYDAVSMCAVAGREHSYAKMVGSHAVELGQCPFADYAVFEADYAKGSSALEGGPWWRCQFITFEGSAVSGKRGVYAQNHHH